MEPDENGKVIPENYFRPTDEVLNTIGDLYTDFYYFKSQRDGSLRQFQYKSFEDVLKISRELFWNSTTTKSTDLEGLGLNFAFPFVRKEAMDFLGRIVSLNIAPVISGEGISMHGVRVLQAMYKKWRIKSVDRVEKFWQTLYGIVNGTVCIDVSWDGKESEQSFLREYNIETGEYKIETEKIKKWNDVRANVVPIEEIYLSKIWERNIQKQGKTIRLQEMTESDFKSLYGSNPLSKFVVAGNRISSDSLYYQLLGGTGIDMSNKIQVLTMYDTDKDVKLVVAGGIPMNMLGKGKQMRVSPNPFTHKMQPYVWAVHDPIDEKFAYGLPMPFKIKDSSKLLNTSYSMLVENELRAIDRPYLTSDIEAPSIIFGEKKVIPVMDVNAYKPIDVQESSGAFYNMMNSLQGVMTSQAQGGSQQIAPSKQPKAAREVIAMEEMKQQSLGNALVLYYDMVYQELMLVLKTALQFYPSGKFAGQQGNLVRAMTIPDFPLMKGGVGRMEARIVKEPQNALALYLEAQRLSIAQGKTTEIIEFPVGDFDKLLEFTIEDVKLEPQKSNELEKAAWNEQVLQPLLNFWIPMGLADPAKAFLRWAEKNGEHVANFASDKAMPQLMTDWSQRYQIPAPELPQQISPVGRAGQGAMTGNLNQSTTGTTFGSQSNGGIPQPQYNMGANSPFSRA